MNRAVRSCILLQCNDAVSGCLCDTVGRVMAALRWCQVSLLRTQ